MSESATYRSCRCGEVTAARVGEEVLLSGWVRRSRDQGGIIFIDLRDRSGYLRPVRGGEHNTCCWHSQRMAPCSVMPGPAAPRLVTGRASGIVPTLPSFQERYGVAGVRPRRVARAGQDRRPEAMRQV